MSFIYNDEKLINELLKSAIDFENRFLKKAQQAAPGPAPDPQAVRNSAALKLLDNLEKSVDPDEPIISSTTDEAKLYSYHVENLGALLNFVIQNGITVGYKPIAVEANPNDPSYVFYKLEGNAGFNESADRSRQTKGFYVNKDLLVQYIKSLQKIAHESGNEVMRVQLGSLIDQANNQLGTKIDPNYKPKEKPGQPEQPQQPGKPGQISSVEMELLKSLINNLPLQAESIDFTRIKYFCDTFEKLLQNSRHAEAPSILTNISNLKTAMENASQMTSSKGDLRISTSGTWQDIKNQLASTVAGAVTSSYRPFLDNLSYIVTTAAALVDSLYAMYRRTVFDTPNFSDAADEIKQQSMTGGSYKIQNSRIISGWKDATSKAVQLKT